MAQKFVQNALAALRARGRFVLTAPTGSGKSTLIPPALIGEVPGRILVLEPRRVAARALATYVARRRGGKVGDEVGYWVRFDNRTQAGTRLTYMTEGIFLQLLRLDPELRGVSAVVFDEFHERSVFSDAALALVKALIAERRPDLWVGVMSATLDVDRLGAYLDAPVIRAGSPVVESTEGDADVVFNGRFRVEVRYRPGASLAGLFAEIAELGDGAVLIFEPGKAEIAATIEEVRQALPNAWALPLHSEIPDDDQDLVFRPAPEGMRKVVVATNIAETSITIPDVQFVIDRGWERVFRYDHKRGFGALRLERISRASAAQRAGRAGRLRDGVVFRTWSREEHMRLPEARDPEIRRVDLAGMVLLLKAFGVREPAHLDWLDHPGVEALEAAERTLYTLGALGPDGELTEVGRAMQRLPLEPHVARMVVEARRVGGLATVVKVAALLSVPRVLLRPRERLDEAQRAQEPFLRAAREGKSDLFALVAAYEAARQHNFDLGWCREHFVRRKALVEAHEIMAQLRDVLQRHGIKVRREDNDLNAARRAIAAGFADELWRQEWRDEYRRNGHRGVRGRESVVYAEWVVAAERRIIPLRRGGELPLILLLTAVDPAWLVEIAPRDQVAERVEDVRFDPQGRRAVATRVVILRGQEVARETVPHDGEGATRAVARALADLRLTRDDPLYPVAQANAELARRVEAARKRNVADPCAPLDLATWYEARLEGATSLEGVSPDALRLTDEAVTEIIGRPWPQYEEETFRVCPDQIDVAGHRLSVSYSTWGDPTATVDVPEELLPVLRDSDLPEFPGYRRLLTAGLAKAATADGLRERVAARPVYDTWPDILKRVQVGAALEVVHPDGRTTVPGYWGLADDDEARVYPTREEALEATRKALQALLRQEIREALSEEPDGAMLANRYAWEDLLGRILAAFDPAGLDPKAAARLARTARAGAMAVLREWRQAREEAAPLEEEAAEMARSPFLPEEERDRLQNLAYSFKRSVSYGRPNDALPAYRELRERLAAARKAVGDKARRLEALRGRLEELEGRVPTELDAYLAPLLEEARAALDTGDRWDPRVPDLDRAEAALQRAEAGLEHLAPHAAEVMAAEREYLTACPLCGTEMRDHGCRYAHNPWDLEAVDFPEDEEKAVVGRLVTDAGDPIVLLVVDRTDGRLRVERLLPKAPFAEVRYEQGALLSAEERQMLERLRDLEWEIQELEQVLQEWAPRPPAALEDLVGSVFPDVRFRRGEHRGKPQWQARVPVAGVTVKLVVGRWQHAPDPDTAYAARVVKVLARREGFAVALVEIKDVQGLRQTLQGKKAEARALRAARERLGDNPVEEGESADESAPSGEDTVSLAEMLAAAWGARVR